MYNNQNDVSFNYASSLTLSLLFLTFLLNLDTKWIPLYSSVEDVDWTAGFNQVLQNNAIRPIELWEKGI